MSDRTIVRGLLTAAFAGVLLAFVSNAPAGDITYNIVDYPANETDQYNGGTDTIIGTITTDGVMGTLASQDIVSESISLYNSVIGVTWLEGSSFSFSGQLLATPSQLLLPTGGECELATFEPWLLAPSVNSIAYDNGYDNQFQYGAGVASGGMWAPPPPPLAGFLATNPPDTPGSIGSGGSEWVIAAVPEPSTCTLLTSALLGLGVVYLRRRGARTAEA
jgi:hypothetical protein